MRLTFYGETLQMGIKRHNEVVRGVVVGVLRALEGSKRGKRKKKG